MHDRHFEKFNATRHPDALLRETQGLSLLQHEITRHGINELKIPKIHKIKEQSLVLERVISTSPSPLRMKQAGLGLAKLHKYSSCSSYGLEYDNYIGLNPQINSRELQWGSFFVKHRLGFQINLIENPKVKTQFTQTLNSVERNLTDFLNAHCEKASLCHGDLWSGNILYSEKGCYLIDPATYYGDREVDIAMTEMFAGFGKPFYQGYSTVYPLTQEYSRKAKIYNLYHYLNHYNLFGDSYLSACEDILQHIKLWFR